VSSPAGWDRQPAGSAILPTEMSEFLDGTDNSGL
jgi:hypothetical protein